MPSITFVIVPPSYNSAVGLNYLNEWALHFSENLASCTKYRMGLNIEVILIQNKAISYPIEMKIVIDTYSGIFAIKWDKRIQLKVYDANLANFSN